MSAESIITVLGATAIVLLTFLPTHRLSIVVLGPLCIIVGVCMLFLRMYSWHAPVLLAFGVGGLAVHAWRRRNKEAKGGI